MRPRSQTCRVQTIDTTAPQTGDRVRLHPHLTLLRRDDRDIQLGVDADDATVIADPDGTLTALLELMDGRYRLGELVAVAERHDVSAAQLDSLVTTLTAAGLLQQAHAGRPTAYGVRLVGVGPAGILIGEQLLRAGIGRLILVDPDDSGWGGWGVGLERVQRADHWSQPEIGSVDLTVVVSGCLESDRAVATELTTADHPHLLVRPRAGGAVVGPLVVPGRTSCLRCGDLVRTRTDPAWPRMLAQLCRTRSRWEPLAADWAAALVTTQVLGHLAGRVVETAGATLELGPVDWSWQRRVWPADPACGCCWAPRAEW
jgi:bacteriocin biosynthesis cyclodehydratase domain-containing protein